MPSVRTRAAGRAVVALAVAAILIATMLPTGHNPEITPLLCLVCGANGLADVLSNVILFAPLGLGLAALGVRPRRALLAGAARSLCIGFTQQFIPGRDPSLSDPVFNTTGTALGHAVSRGAPRLLAPSAVAASRLALAAAALAVGVLQLAGYEVAVLHFGGDSVFALPYYALAGVKRTHAWKDYAPAPDVGAAKDLLATCSTLEDLLQLEERGVRIGQFAVSTHLRRFRKGSVDLADEADRHALIADLATARRALAAAEAIRLDAAPHRRLLARPHAAHARADTGLEALTHARGVVN